MNLGQYRTRIVRYCLMSLDTLVILHYNKYHDYGEIWQLRTGSQKGERWWKEKIWLAAKDQFGRCDEPEKLWISAETAGRWQSGRTERSIYVVSEARRRRRCVCTVSDRNVFSAWSWCGKDEEQFLYWLTKSAEQEYGEHWRQWGFIISMILMP